MSDEAVWRDHHRTIGERIENLIGLMTLEEKVSQLTTSAPGIDRLGLPAFRWGGECLHGICNNGRATQFPMPIGMAATFDENLLEKAATAISDEARAKFHHPAWHDAPRTSLTFYTPVINILRDPRWGRAQETYGEDPYLTAVMGAAFVRGLQGDHPKYLKTAACAKHLGAHSGPERLRREFNAEVSRKALAETYLYAFEYLVRAGAAMVMTTYNRVNGAHCCAHPMMMQEFLRDRFGFDGLITSDGGALETLHTSHALTKDAVETAGLCLKSGCHQEIGMNAYPHAAEAIERGFITEADIDRALEHILAVRFHLGEFDPPEDNPYTNIGIEVLQSRKHLKLAREMAVKSLVLLKNDGILPFGNDIKTILVTGPMAADVQCLLGNFYRGASANLRTMLEGITETAPEGVTISHMQGCLLNHPNIYPSDWTFGLSKWADVVVACVGFSPLMEGEQGECICAPEGGDKPEIAIPPNQLDFLHTMRHEYGKKIVAVVTGGCPLELGPLDELADAVLMAWYPGEQGGNAVADVLFGKVSPSGKLPATFPKKLTDLPEYTDYDPEKRSYRYADAEPEYPFGFGLSYTQFAYGELQCRVSSVGSKSSSSSSLSSTVPVLGVREIRDGKTFRISATVSNVGDCAAEEVVQLYVTDEEASVHVPKYALKDFQRIRLKPGQTKRVKFEITADMLSLFDENGDKVLEPGGFTITVGGACPHPVSVRRGAPKPITARITVAV